MTNDKSPAIPANPINNWRDRAIQSPQKMSEYISPKEVERMLSDVDVDTTDDAEYSGDKLT